MSLNIDQLTKNIEKDVGFAFKLDNLIKFKDLIKSDPGTWVKIEQLFKKHKILRNINKSIKQLAPNFTKKQEKQLVIEVFPEIPLRNFAVTPNGWLLQDPPPGCPGAICKKIIKDGPEGPEEKLISVSPYPVIITKRYMSVRTNLEYLRVDFCKHGEWYNITAPREHFFNAQYIVAFASRGLPVTSLNKLDLIEWLAAYETKNYKEIENELISGQMGWLGPDENPSKYGFLSGKKHITNQSNVKVNFMGLSSGDDIEADCIKSQGTLKEWLETIKGIEKYPRAELSIYASLASALLVPLQRPGFVVDWSYRTSRGKTTILKVAASVWGRGEVYSPDSPIKAWNTTKAGIEKLCSILNNIPLLLDDTKQGAKYSGVSVIPEIVYSIYNGRGKVRSTRYGGVEETRTWRTVLLSTGEQPITTFDRSEGAATRALSIWGAPFNDTNQETALFIDKLNLGLNEHFGHLGPIFVEQLIKHQDKWPELNKELAEITNKIRDMLSKEHSLGVAGRLAQSLAIIELTGRLVHKIVEFPWTYNSPIERCIFADVNNSASEADQAVPALRDIYTWALGRQGQFEGRISPGRDPISILGQWMPDTVSSSWGTISIFCTEVHNELIRLGYDKQAIIRVWKESGYIETRAGKNYKPVTVMGERAGCYVIKRESIEEVVGPSDDLPIGEE